MTLSAPIEVTSPVERTSRVLQLEGMFDLQPQLCSSHKWQVYLPLADRPWNIGLIVGPSGCGKSTIARRLWPEAFREQASLGWDDDKSILDSFAAELSVKEIVTLLSSVGFSSPPAWLKPFKVLSTGQQFRVTLARYLAEAIANQGGLTGPQSGHGVQGDPGTGAISRPRQHSALVVFDEYTSVVDRTVAQIGSAALAKTVRARGLGFIAVTCHEDVEPWLNPDWVYRPDSNTFTWRSLCPRPSIKLQVSRVHRQAWKLFHEHHYLSETLAPAAQCFVATWHDRPVAFSAWIHAIARIPTKREHRTVTLPDFQGVGIGHALSTHLASAWKALGFRATSTTTHPAFIAARKKDPNWIMTRAPSFAGVERGRFKAVKHATTRLTAGFAYVGPAMQINLARRLLGV